MAGELERLSEAARRTLEVIERGQTSFMADYVVNEFVHPILQMREGTGDPEDSWRTLPEAIEETGRNRNFFEKPLKSLGCNRLEDWERRGMARQTPTGRWMLSPEAVAEAKAEGPRPTSGPKPAPAAPDPAVEELEDFFDAEAA